MAVLSNTGIRAGASAGGGSSDSTYRVKRSTRFNDGDSAYLNQTFATGNRKTWTWSAWVKRSTFGAVQSLMQITHGGYTRIWFADTDQLAFDGQDSSAQNGSDVKTNRLFRDPSAWYHICVAMDTTQATDTNRLKMYVNGVQETSFDSPTWPTQNVDYMFNYAQAHNIGRNVAGSQYFDGYLADIHFIDGTAKAASDFGETNADTGQWVPKEYDGTYGTNGFHLSMDPDEASPFGDDSSGNGNDWTANNLSTTAGTGNDLLTDTPGAPYDNDLNGGGNYCTYNPLHSDSGNNTCCTLSEGNLKAEKGSDDWQVAVGTMRVSSGKWYWENTVEGNDNCMIGITKYTAFNGGGNGSQAFYYSNDVWAYYPDGAPSSGKITGNNFASYGSTASDGDIIATCLDMDNGKLTFYLNGTSLNDAYTGLSGTFAPLWGTSGTAGATKTNVNFGQRPFEYTPPTGYKALNAYNTSEPDEAVVPSNKAFDSKLWTGDGGTKDISYEFNPDLFWAKRRTGNDSHHIYDRVRGDDIYLQPDDVPDEATDEDSCAFGTNKVTLGDTRLNPNSITFVGWAWDAGSSNDTSDNTGSITPTAVRANSSTGFSIISYTGEGTSGDDMGHGLGVAPQFVIIKNRDQNDAWAVMHTEAGLSGDNIVNTSIPEYKMLYLNEMNATANWTGDVVAPDGSAKLTLGSGPMVNESGEKYIAYCWTEIPGYSKFGSYEGTNSDPGTFVWCGFRPRWLLIKGDVANEDWCIIDAEKESHNDGTTIIQFVNGDDPEYENSAYEMDILSNGFKLRNTNARFNQSNTYLFAAFAESSFKYANAR